MSGLLLTLTLLDIQIAILALRLLLLRYRSSGIIGVILPWIWAVFGEVAWLSTVVTGEVMGYWALVMNTRAFGCWGYCWVAAGRINVCGRAWYYGGR
jgi:hypothetical protein